MALGSSLMPPHSIADLLYMSVSGISESGLSAIAAGWRGQLKAQQQSSILKSAGMLNPNMAKSLDAIQASAKSITKAGAEIVKTELLGNLLDVLG